MYEGMLGKVSNQIAWPVRTRHSLMTVLRFNTDIAIKHHWTWSTEKESEINHSFHERLACRELFWASSVLLWRAWGLCEVVTLFFIAVDWRTDAEVSIRVSFCSVCVHVIIRPVFRNRLILLLWKLILLTLTQDHKTSHKGQFYKIYIYASSESWISHISIDVWFVMIGQYL